MPVEPTRLMSLLREFASRYERYLHESPDSRARRREDHEWLLLKVHAVESAVTEAGGGSLLMQLPDGRTLDPFLVFLDVDHAYFEEVCRAVHSAVIKAIGYLEWINERGTGEVPPAQRSEAMKSKSPVLFLSHAHCDKAIVGALLDFLKSSMMIHDEDIRCTSISGMKLEYGKSISNLRQEIVECTVFFQFLSAAAQSRPNVIMELGAAWASERPLYILLGKGVPFHATGFVSDQNHLSSDSDDFAKDVNGFVRQIAAAAGCKLQSEESRERAREKLIAAISALLQEKNPEDKSPPTSTPLAKLRVKVQTLIDSLDAKKSVVGHDVVASLNRYIQTAKELNPQIELEILQNPKRGPGSTFGLSNLTPTEIRIRAGELLAEIGQ